MRRVITVVIVLIATLLSTWLAYGAIMAAIGNAAFSYVNEFFFRTVGFGAVTSGAIGLAAALAAYFNGRLLFEILVLEKHHDKIRKFVLPAAIPIALGAAPFVDQWSESRCFDRSSDTPLCSVWLQPDGKYSARRNTASDPPSSWRKLGAATRDDLAEIAATGTLPPPKALDVRACSDEIEFFESRSGTPLIYWADRGGGRVKLFVGKGVDPVSGESLQPIVRGEVQSLCKKLSESAPPLPKVGPKFPVRVPVDCDSTQFFDPLTKSPLLFAAPMPDGSYQFFDSAGYHPTTGASLNPVDANLVAKTCNLQPGSKKQSAGGDAEDGTTSSSRKAATLPPKQNASASSSPNTAPATENRGRSDNERAMLAQQHFDKLREQKLTLEKQQRTADDEMWQTVGGNADFRSAMRYLGRFGAGNHAGEAKAALPTPLLTSTQGCLLSGLPVGIVTANPPPVSWSGACSSGIAEGQGEVRAKSSRGTYVVLAGSFSSGWPTGEWSANFAEDVLSTSAWSIKSITVHFLPSGQLLDHVTIRATGVDYSGGSHVTFRNWQTNPNGQGVMTWPDGRKYVGQWSNGKREGSGEYTNAQGARFAGMFRGDHEEGLATIYFPDGTREQVTFQNGTRVGLGIKYDANGHEIGRRNF